MRIKITDVHRSFAALQTAAYIKWYECRNGYAPVLQHVYKYVRGLIDDELVFDEDDLAKIEVLAHSVDPVAVQEFIIKSKVFDRLDFAENVIRSTK